MLRKYQKTHRANIFQIKSLYRAHALELSNECLWVPHATASSPTSEFSSFHTRLHAGRFSTSSLCSLRSFSCVLRGLFYVVLQPGQSLNKCSLDHWSMKVTKSSICLFRQIILGGIFVCFSGNFSKIEPLMLRAVTLKMYSYVAFSSLSLPTLILSFLGSQTK